MLRETHREIQRIDQEAKEVHAQNKAREERKDNIIEELKGFIDSLKWEIAQLKKGINVKAS